MNLPKLNWVAERRDWLALSPDGTWAPLRIKPNADCTEYKLWVCKAYRSSHDTLTGAKSAARRLQERWHRQATAHLYDPCPHGIEQGSKNCPECLTREITHSCDDHYSEEDRDRWMRLALAQLAPAGTWPAQLFRDLRDAATPAEAVRLAQAARSRLEPLWGAWDLSALPKE